MMTIIAARYWGAIADIGGGAALILIAVFLTLMVAVAVRRY